MAFDTMTKEIKEKLAQKPGNSGGSRSGPSNAPAFGQGKQLRNDVTPGAEPTVQNLASVNLKKKRDNQGRGGCC